MAKASTLLWPIFSPIEKAMEGNANAVNNTFPIPRLCVLTKSSGAEEYGFNLHAELGRGQFVGAVDLGSSAQMADLRPGDHIVAVNGDSIEGLSHKEVVQRIKSNPVRCSLLVLDEEGVLWHKERGLPLTAEFLLKRLNNATGQQRLAQVEVMEEEEPVEVVEKPVDVPTPLPRGRKGKSQVLLSSSPAGTSPYGTEESGSCSIALPASTPGSPLSKADGHERTPVVVQLLSAEEEQRQKPRPSQAVQANPQPHQQQQQQPASSPPESAIGRHAAVPLPPPGTLLANGPKPRLCTLKKANAKQEFGFNLHAERGKGHFIGAVDKDGVAERAGLETGQRIVGVNGRIVYPNTPHKEIVQLIKRDPLCTELLVASEEVDRFYAEYGLVFSYDFVHVFHPPVPNGIASSVGTRPRQADTTHMKPVKPQNGMARQERASSGSSTSVEEPRGARNDYDLRSRGNSLGQRPPTPTSTYSKLKQSKQPNGHIPPAVAVQIEQRPDNMTSIEIGELEENGPDVHQHIGIGTPPSSRCDEKWEKEEEPAQLQKQKQLNGKADEEDEAHKHVITDGGGISPPSSTSPASTAFPPSNKARVAPAQPQGVQAVQQQLQEKLQEKYSLPLSPPSRQQPRKEEKRKEHGKDIFAMSAKEARKAICGRKRDPRLEGHMTLEEKHRLILDL